jgi:predicted RecA/RadA family phage recombinase
MKTYVQDDEKLLVIAPYAVAGGAGCLVGSLFGVAESTAASGASVNLVLRGVFDLVKLAGTAWTVGAKVYWDDSAKNCTLVVGANKQAGVVAAAAISGAVVGRVLLSTAYTI